MASNNAEYIEAAGIVLDVPLQVSLLRWPGKYNIPYSLNICRNYLLMGKWTDLCFCLELFC